MTPYELRAILDSDKKITINELCEIIYELKQDCINESHRLTMENIENCDIRFYDGEVNAFYICLDLLDKVKE